MVCLLETFLTFRTRPLPFNLVLGISAEEECMGENGIRALLPALGKVDMALVGEPTGMQAATGERGLVVLDWHGRTAGAATRRAAKGSTPSTSRWTTSRGCALSASDGNRNC